jgi:hypothetical protein
MALHELDQQLQQARELLETADTAQGGGDALVAIGMSHIRMGRVGLGLHEIWSGMHGRTGLSNTATALVIGGMIYNPGLDEKATEYQQRQR